VDTGPVAMHTFRNSIAAALLSGGLAVTVIGLAPATAQADPSDPVPEQSHNWCPGQGLPFPGIQWDMGVCHTWYTVPVGTGNVRMATPAGNAVSSFVSADIPPPMLTPPPPAPPPPPHPFCTPRGGLIIIPPICDEIGQ
jgi:hypothetical protein